MNPLIKSLSILALGGIFAGTAFAGPAIGDPGTSNPEAAAIALQKKEKVEVVQIALFRTEGTKSSTTTVKPRSKTTSVLPIAGGRLAPQSQ